MPILREHWNHKKCLFTQKMSSGEIQNIKNYSELGL